MRTLNAIHGCVTAILTSLLLLIVPNPALAAELVTLSEANYAEFAPRGKGARAFFGDYVLRNEAIVAAIADPTLLSGRSASRWAIPNVSGCLIDFTRRDAQNDQLTAFYPAPQRYKPDAPTAQDEFVDERLAANQPGRSPRKAEKVELLVPPYELESGKMLDELAKLPEHLRGAPKPSVEVRYILADGWRHLQVDTTIVNPTASAITPNMSVRFRVDPTARSGVSMGGKLAWIYDKWWRQAYGVLADGHAWDLRAELITGEVSLGYRSGDGKPVRVEGNGKITATRMLLTGPDVFAVRADASRLIGESLRRIRLVVKGPDGVVADADITAVDADGAFFAAGRTDANGVLEIELPKAEFTLSIAPMGRSEIKVSISNNQSGELAIECPQAAARIAGDVKDEAGKPIPCKIQLIGRDNTPDPDFFPVTGEHAVRNVLLTANGTVARVIPPGRYEAVISHGPEYDPVKVALDVKPGDTAKLDVSLRRSVNTQGWISADLHNHSAATGRSDLFYVYPYTKDITADGDSFGSPLGLVLNLLAENVEFAPTSDHNFVTSFTPYLEQLKAASLMATCPGVGMTAGRRHTTTHQNVFPLKHVPGAQDGGVQQRPEHIGQAEWLLKWDGGENKLVQVVGTRGDPASQFLGADAIDVIDLDPIIDRKPMPGRDNRILQWLELLDNGYRAPGVVNSNAFDNFQGAGRNRNYIQSPTDDPAKVEVGALIRAIERGRVLMTTGPFMTVELRSDSVNADASPTLPGDTVRITDGKARIRVRVQANAATTIDRVQVLVNGKNAPSLDFTRSAHAGRFSAGPMQFDQEIPLMVADDSYIIVVASGTGENLHARTAEDRKGRIHVAVSSPIWIDAGAQGYLPRSPLDDMVDASLQFIESPVAKAGSEPGRVRLTLKNRGSEPAEDTAILKVVPPEAARVVGPLEQRYTLPYKGAEMSVDWRIEFNEDYLRKNFPLTQNYNLTNRFGVRVDRASKPPGREAAAHWMMVDHHVGSLAPMTDPARLPSALAGEVVYPFRPPLAGTSMKMAITGQHLAVVVDVVESELKREAVVWEGSCVELFACMPGRHPKNKKAGGYYDIGQVYLAPAVGNQPAAGFHRLDEKIVTAKDIQITSEKTKEGYRIAALVPLSLMLLDVDEIVRFVYLNTGGYTDMSLVGLEARPGRFMFDARVNAVLKAGEKRVRSTVFGSAAPHVDSSSMGTMRPEGGVTARIEVLKGLSAKSDGPPGRVRVRLVNQARTALSDTVTLMTEPSDAGTISDESTFAFNLKPGEETAREFEVTLKPGAKVNSLALVLPRSPGGVVVSTPSPRMNVEGRSMPRVAPIADVGSVKAALSSVPETIVPIKDQTAGKIRFAITGGMLAIHAQVIEAELLHDAAKPWKGSVFEVFVASTPGGPIKQVFLLPAVEKSAALALMSREGKPTPLKDASLVAAPMAGGYEMSVLIPLESLGIDPAGKQMMLELQVTTKLGANPRATGTAYGSPRAYMDNSLYGRFDLK